MWAVGKLPRVPSAIGDGTVDVRGLTAADAKSIATWRHPPELATYDFLADDLDALALSSDLFRSITSDGELVGYVCLGAQARVPGLEPSERYDDIGWGLRPDLVGRGLSGTVLSAAIDRLKAEGSATAPELRIVVLDWNLRSLSAAERPGFSRAGTHRAPEGLFVVMTRPWSLPSGA